MENPPLAGHRNVSGCNEQLRPEDGLGPGSLKTLARLSCSYHTAPCFRFADTAVGRQARQALSCAANRSIARYLAALRVTVRHVGCGPRSARAKSAKQMRAPISLRVLGLAAGSRTPP